MRGGLFSPPRGEDGYHLTGRVRDKWLCMQLEEVTSTGPGQRVHTNGWVSAWSPPSPCGHLFLCEARRSLLPGLCFRCNLLIFSKLGALGDHPCDPKTQPRITRATLNQAISGQFYLIISHVLCVQGPPMTCTWSEFQEAMVGAHRGPS